MMQFVNAPQDDLNRTLQSSLSSFEFATPSITDGAEQGHATAFDAMRHWFRPRSNKRCLLLAFRQLALLVETGIDVAEALELVAAGCKHGVLQESLQEVFEDISNGKSLSLAISSQKHVLGDDVAASVQAGEASGQLVNVLRQIADQLEEELQIRSSLTGALAYPAILCTASVAVASILIWFVLPQFEESFVSMGIEPPAVTQLLLNASHIIREHVVALSAGLVLTGILLAIALAQPRVRQMVHHILFFSPILGPALRNLAVGRLFVSLAHLLGNGISLLEAIQLTRRNSAGGGAISRLTASWEADVIEGKGLTQNLHEFRFLPNSVSAMLVMAEKTGKLESVLQPPAPTIEMKGVGD